VVDFGHPQGLFVLILTTIHHFLAFKSHKYLQTCYSVKRLLDHTRIEFILTYPTFLPSPAMHRPSNITKILTLHQQSVMSLEKFLKIL